MPGQTRHPPLRRRPGDVDRDATTKAQVRAEDAAAEPPPADGSAPVDPQAPADPVPERVDGPGVTDADGCTCASG